MSKCKPESRSSQQDQLDLNFIDLIYIIKITLARSFHSPKLILIVNKEKLHQLLIINGKFKINKLKNLSAFRM